MSDFQNGLYIIVSILLGIILLLLIYHFFFSAYGTDKCGNSHKGENISPEFRVLIVILYGVGLFYFLKNPNPFFKFLYLGDILVF